MPRHTTSSFSIPSIGSLSLALLAVGVATGCGDSGGVGPTPPAPISTSTPSTAPVAGGATVQPETSGAPASTDWTVSTAASDPKIAEVGGLVFPKPPTWVWASPRMQFRTLQYEVPGVGEGTGAAELVFSLFRGTDGGPTDMNIDRWVGQFRTPEGGQASAKTATSDVGGLTVMRMETSGSYQAMGQPAPRPGQMQFGAIVEAPGRRVFVRIVGPEATVEAARKDFDRLIEGVMPAG